ncbi:protein prenyltransferase alpha subunit repeat-containing protein 1 isoform X3 [Syngnathus scovelli]|uniref:protein prenyltransferase alpha subunit repeat-containing protein 1 isoform X3 n=1 Tax=Syngnathus scovelli TaxID=161590 RepID=UPI0035CA05F7
MAESRSELDVLVQRVVKDISNALKRNPNIDEIGVIPCPEGRYNRSPIVVLENKLGVESWCLKFLLPYVHSKLLLYRQQKHWLDKEALVDITSTLLLLNPDFTTAWNVRCHTQYLCFYFIDLAASSGIAYITHKARKGVNSAWSSYCRNGPLLGQVGTHQIPQEPGDVDTSVFQDELSTMRQWVLMHVTDHSGFHYRQFLLKELIEDFSQPPAPSIYCSPQQQSMPRSRFLSSINPLANGKQLEINAVDQDERELELFELFHQEIELCSDLIRSFPGHETLWSHRRHVFYLWHQWRWEHQLIYFNSNGGTVLHNIGDAAQLKPGAQGCGDRGAGAIEVDGIFLPDPCNKRLKRGGYESNLPSLSSECTFLSAILDRQCNPEQRHFGLAYKKWLDSVINKAL